MSLLDDVSIVVTPNGYKAGELYAVIPVPTEGADVVVDGDFPTPNVNWSLTNTTIETDGAKIDNTIVTGFAGISQLLLGSTSGRQFVLTYDVTATNGEDLVLDNGTSLYLNTSTTGTNRKLYYTWDRGDNYLVIKRAVANTNVTIDNVILQELTSADMDVTRATAATRVDENGLVNYAEVLGGEEVTNGDFTELPLGTGWTVTGSDADNYVVFDGSTVRLKFLNTIPVTILNSSFSFTSGKTYKLVVDIASVTSGGVKVDTAGVSELFNTAGVSTRIINPTGNGALGFYRATANVDLTFNSVSLKEVTRDNVPRIDYTGGGCPHILAEPERTNLITYSEDFSNTAWQKSDITATPNSITSPDGTLNAYKLTKPTSSTPRLFELSVYPSTGVHTFTAFYKNLDGDSMLIRLDGGGNTANCTVDLTTNTLANSGANIISSNITQLSDGWIRVSVTANILSTSWVLDAVNLFSISVGSSVYIWGAQLEEGSYATSYIPTDGGTVTRVQDQYSKTGISNLINSEEGVLFLEVAALSDDLTYRTITISDNTNTNNNRVLIQFSNTTNKIIGLIGSGGSTQAVFITTSYNTLESNKIAITWKLNEFKMFINGDKIGEDNLGATPVGLNYLALDSALSGDTFYGKVKQLQVFKTALTDSELIALTT